MFSDNVVVVSWQKIFCNDCIYLYCMFSNSEKWIPSLKLTYPLKIDPWKRRFLLGTIIFRGYVSFREGSAYSYSDFDDF